MGSNYPRNKAWLSEALGLLSLSVFLSLGHKAVREEARKEESLFQATPLKMYSAEFAVAGFVKQVTCMIGKTGCERCFMQ